MKKTALLVSTLILGMSLVSMVPQVSEAADSEGTVGFVPNDQPKDPVDPNDPGTPHPDPKPDPTGETGELALAVVPKFSFGSTNKINQSAGASLTDETAAPYTHLQINDDRGEESLGWHVTVSRTAFTKTGGVKLDGAVLSLPKGTLRNQIKNAAQGNDTDTATPITNNSIEAFAIEIPEGATSPATLVDTDGVGSVGKGATVYNVTENSSSKKAELKVPAGKVKQGDFTSTITWTAVAGAKA